MSLPMKPGRTPRPWQTAATDAARFALNDPTGPKWRSGLIVAGTGSGKGDCLAGIAVSHAMKGGRCMVVVDREELVNDVAGRCREVAIAHGVVSRDGRARVGVVMAERNEARNPIVVASIQSASQPERLANIGTVSLLIIDEAHGATAPSHVALQEAIRANYPASKTIGFTATGFRGDGNEGLGDVFEGVIYEHTVAAATEAGDIVPIEGWGVPTSVSIEGISVGENGELNEAELEDKINNPDRNRLAWTSYLEHAKGRPALFFALNVRHAHALAEMGRKEFGINAQAVHGPNKKFPLSKAECKRRVDEYKNHPERLPVLCSCDLIRVGFDAPETYAVVLCRPWKSLVAYVQTIGRGTRVVGIPKGLTEPAEIRAAIARSRKPKMVFIQLVDIGTTMTLDHAVNLQTHDKDTKESKALDVGDEAARRRHLDWGTGVIQEIVAEESPLGRLVSVLWPISVANPAGGLKEHPMRDLQRPPIEVEPDDEPVERATISISGGAAYRLGLLPGEKVEDPNTIGWYEHAGTWTTGAFAEGIGRIKMHVRVGAKGWEVWSLRPPIAAREEPGTDDIATMKRGDCDTKETAMAWANAHLRAHRAQTVPIMAERNAKPATSGQLGLLRGKFSIRRDLSSMCMGEATALIDACKAAQRVGDVLDPGKAHRREFMRQKYRGARQAA